MKRRVDINCDLGEGKHLPDCHLDAELMPYIDRCNIACGGHAGNTDIMQLTLDNAKAHQLKTGAHPGYPDPANFGRKSLSLPYDFLKDSLLTQVNNLQRLATARELTLTHIKCHGALYLDIETSAELACKIADWFHEGFPGIALMGLPGGQMEAACKDRRYLFLREGFMDRRYLPSGQLTPRSQSGAIITKVPEILDQAERLMTSQPVKTSEDSLLTLTVDSICLHSDHPAARLIASSLNNRLAQS